MVYVAGILAMLLLAGQLSDRFGRRQIVVPALAISAVSSAVLILGRDSFAALMIGRVGLGIASGAALGVGAAWLQELLGRGNELRAALINTVVVYGGFGLGPPISTLWEQWGPSPLVWPFVVHIVGCAAVVPLVWTATETVDVAEAASRGRWRPEIRLGVPEAARRRFWIVLAPLAVFVFAFPSTGFSLFPILVSDDFDGSAVLLTGVAGVLTPWGGLLARPYLQRVAHDAALVHGATIGTGGYLLATFAWSTGTWFLVWPAALALGMASGLLSTGGLTAVGEMTDDDNRGALSSTFYFLAYIGMATPLAVTAVAGLIGMGATLAGLCAIAIVVTATTPRRRRVAAASVRPVTPAP